MIVWKQNCLLYTSIRRITGMSVWHHNIGRLIARVIRYKNQSIEP